MSNENSSSNVPRRVRRGCNAPSGRGRKFSCITYLSELQLSVCLSKHFHQIRCYAYAYHDKDTKDDGSLKEPHIHLVIVTNTTCTISSIRRWFSGYLDNKGMEITTTAQLCSDIYSMYDYLTHSTKEAIEQGKYQYKKSIIVSNNKEYFQASEESEWDNLQLAMEKLIEGTRPRDLAKMYGRDFIIHYGQIKQVIRDDLQYDCIQVNSIQDIIKMEQPI